MNESSALIARLKRIATTGMPTQGDVRPVDAWLTQGMAASQMHEIFATVDDSASGAGFAVASVLAARAAPMMWLRTEASERQGGRLHATGLVEMGLDLSSLVLGLVEDEASLLRAAADAARCHGLGTLLIESWGRAPGIDLTATRRLMLAAEASGVTILSLRIGAEPVPSAAASRWQVAACRSRRWRPTRRANLPSTSNCCVDVEARPGFAGVWSGTVTRISSTKPPSRPPSSILKQAVIPRRYLALVFPWLPIERLRTMRPHLFVGRAETPVAFVETVSGGIRLKALDREAVRAGLQPGLTLADARARVPELEVYEHDAHADHEWLERLADGCQRYTPSVALDEPDGLILDIAGCVHEFEGERRLAADLEERLARRGVLVRHAFGDTPIRRGRWRGLRVRLLR